jgi:IS1 transposase
VEVRRRIVCGTAEDIAMIIHTDGCGAEVNTAYVERNNLTMRQSVGRLVRKALSFSKNVHFLQRHIDLDDAIYNFVKPHSALRRRVRGGTPQGRKWQQRTPAMAAGLTDHVWSLEELLMFQA